jgi:hypothetical protein
MREYAMAKLIPITKVVHEQVDNVRCDHCDVYINGTEHYSKYGYVFWCNECVEEDYGTLDAVLKSIDDKFQYLPQVYYDTSKSTITYPDNRYTFTLNRERKQCRYYWWMSGEHVNKIKAIPKRDTPRATSTYTGLMIRETTDGRYCWHAPKESTEAIKPDPIVIINKPFTFNIKWSDGTEDTFIDGVRQ